MLLGSSGALTLYEVSSEARVELDAAAYPIQSPLLGRVVEAHLRVGQTVQRGDVLVEIDAAPEQLQDAPGKYSRTGVGSAK